MKPPVILLPALAPLLIAANEPLSPEEETEHVVVAGETLGGIANRAKVPRVLIAEANGLEPPYVIRVGETLKIPRTQHHTVERGETGLGIASRYGVPWKDIVVANDLDPEAPILVGQVLLIPTLIEPPRPAQDARAVLPPEPQFAWPIEGSIRRSFRPRGQRNYHDGIDIRARRGTAVRASEAGTVIFAGKEKHQFGNLVVIDHGGDWHTAYGFLLRITVRKGERVEKGERIGLVGNTGKARGDELHFEVRKDAAAVDPMDELAGRP